MMNNYRRARFCGPLAPYAEGLRAELAALAYAPSTVTSHLGLWAQLDRWLVGWDSMISACGCARNVVVIRASSWEIREPIARSWAARSATMLAATSCPGTTVCCALPATTAAAAIWSAPRTFRLTSHARSREWPTPGGSPA